MDDISCTTEILHDCVHNFVTHYLIENAVTVKL